MEAVHDLPLFLAAGLLLNLTPGPDMLYVLGTSTSRGQRAGGLAALGIGAGCLVHVAMAAVGLSAVIATSPWAFDLVKLLGAAYLVYAGSMLIVRRAVAPAATEAVRASRGVFVQGMLVNVLNPKVALFFLAFLPQFIDAARPGKTWAFVVLGLLFTLSGTLVNLGVATLAGWLQTRLAARHRGAPAGRTGALARRIDQVAGLLFVGLGVRLALSGRP